MEKSTVTIIKMGKFKVKRVEDSRVVHTSKGNKYVERLIVEDENGEIHKVIVWDRQSHVGDVITGEIETVYLIQAKNCMDKEVEK